MAFLRLAAAIGVGLVASSAEAAEPPLHFVCEAPEGVTCDDVRTELVARLGERGRAVEDGAGLPRAHLSPGRRGSVAVEIEVAHRPPAVREVRIAGEASPAWTLALTVEQLLALEEAAATRRDPVDPIEGPREEAPRSDVWIGLVGGLRYDPVPGPALQAGGVGAWSIGRIFARARAYGEYADVEYEGQAYRGEAFAVGAGPGYLLVDRALRLGITLDAFARFVAWQNPPYDARTSVEMGGGIWVDGILTHWIIRPYVTIGLDVFVAHARVFSEQTGELLFIHSLVAPGCQIGLVYSP